MEYALRLGRSSRKGLEVQILSEAPKWNLTVFQRPNCGRLKAPPTDFPPFFQTNSERRLRRRALFFRPGGGASQRFLWHRPFSPKGLNQKQFCLMTERLLAIVGKVRANHSACVKS